MENDREAGVIPRTARRERYLVRALVALAFTASLAITLRFGTHEPLPAIALQSEALFHVERALALFYGGLLALLPLVRGIGHGELPIELSPRGARYADLTHTAEISAASTARLESRTAALEKDLERTVSVVDKLLEQRRASRPNGG